MMEVETETPAVGTAEPTEPPLPLAAVDAALAPLRRTLRWALDAPPTQVRFLEANGGRWLHAALELDLPHAVREQLVALSGQLHDFDGVSPEARHARVSEMWQVLCRIDAVLGLPGAESTPDPEPTASRPTSSKRREEAASQAMEASARNGRRSKSRSRDTEPRRSPREPDEESNAASEARAAEGGWLQRALEDVLGDDALPLTEAGLATVGDLVLRPPTEEQVIKPTHGAGRPIPHGRVAVGGRVRARHTVLQPNGERAPGLVLVGAGPLTCRWSQPLPAWLDERLVRGTRVVLVGQLEGEGEAAVLHDAELALDDGTHGVRLGSFGIEGVDDRQVRAALVRVLPSLEGLWDPLSTDLLRRNALPSLRDAIGHAHSRGQRGADARKRLAFDEALLAQLGTLLRRLQVRERGIGHAVVHGLAARLKALYDLETTDAQEMALGAILRDLRRPAPMQRVLTGEVGEGKGLIALLAAVAVAESKSQVLVLAQDRVVAEQAFLFAEPMLREIGLVARFVDDSPNRAQRDAIRRGEVHLIYGIQDVLEQEVEFRRLGLVIAEERRQYGGVIGRVLALRAPRPDLLVTTPGPIGPSLQLVAYPGCDVTTLRPPSPLALEGRVYASQDRQMAYEVAAAQVAAGRQAYVVFPLSKGADALDAREAMRVVGALGSEIFPNARVALFHGGMSREDRARTYDDFRRRRYDVLVATTCFENGPFVPGATVAVVEQADRMHPVRLLRVRGHLARSEDGVGCQYITGSVPDEAGMAMLEELAAGKDGFELARAELKRMGVDALAAPEVAAREIARPRFRWVRPDRDDVLFERAQEAARDLLDHDPSLRAPGNADLARYLQDRWFQIFDEECPIQLGTSSGSRRRRRRRRR